MATYVGWSPTITGRVAFSRVASGKRDHPEICNQAGTPDGFIFGREVRTSPDGPLPAWVLRQFRRLPDQHFAVFLDVTDDLLPRAGPDGCEGGVELVRDARGALSGEVYFFSKSELAKSSGALAVLASIAKNAIDARSPRATAERRRQLFEEARANAAKLFERLRAEARSGSPTPAFARARIMLSRTGKCRIEIGSGDLLINRATKIAHRLGISVTDWAATSSAFTKAGGFIARHAFNAIRHLAHQHYHHHRHADLLATTYPWRLDDDQTWRRETQYGLARMAIEIRQRGTAKSFKQCAGVVAYAEAFQLHLCGWHQAPDGTVQAAREVPPYDFSALRNSIDASLKVRELEDAERRQSILYLTTIFLAALALVVGGLRALETPSSGPFEASLAWTTSHPIPTLVLALAMAWWIDLAWLRAALPPPAARVWYYGLKRATAATMGSLMWRGFAAWVSFALPLLGLLAIMGLFAWASGWAMYYAYAVLDVQ